MTQTLPELRWRVPARLSVAGPADWTPSERVEVHHRDGDALVRVETWPVGPDADLEALAAQHLGPEPDLDGWQDSGLQPASVLGQYDGRARQVSWTDLGGTRLRMSVGYCLDRGRMYVVTQLVPDSDADKTGQAAEIASSVVVTSPLEIDQEQLLLRPTDGVDFTAVDAAWRAGVAAPETTEHVVTVEEAFGAARHYGVALLPGADTSVLDSLDQAQRELVTAVAWRSLVARGAQSDPELREALELAAGHDLIVSVTTRTGVESSADWYAARADRMVRIRPTGDGVLLLSTHDTTVLADLVIASAATSDEVSASSVFRRGGSVSGQETSWNPSTDADADVRARLAELLPQS